MQHISGCHIHNFHAFKPFIASWYKFSFMLPFPGEIYAYIQCGKMLPTELNLKDNVAKYFISLKNIFFYFKICRPCWLCVCILIILNKEQRHFRKILVEQIQICWHFASSTFQSHSNWFCTTLLSSISTILINSKHIYNTNRNISEKIWLNKYTIAFKADLFLKLKDTGLCERANIFFILCLQSTAHRGKCERICCFDERWIAPAMTVIFFIRDI